MRKAYDWFYDQVRKRFASNQKGAELAQFIDSLSDKLFFTVITVNDELNAYKVFETLNARGVKLSSTDLLKNYLFSVVHSQGGDEHDLREIEDQWERLVEVIGNESLPDFLRAYWNSKNRFVRHAELFKRVRDRITGKKDVFELIRDVELYAQVYAALPHPEDSLWNNGQSEYIRYLRMFNVRQLYPLLLAGYQQLVSDDFARLLRSCCVISFRYNVIGNLATNEQERVYNRVAVQLSSGEIQGLQQVLGSLKAIYVADDKFKGDFTDKVMRTTQARNKRIVRYILFEIERHTSGNNYDFESDTYNIEHIMPESIDQGWDHIDDRDHEQFLYRLGNMTILNKGVNRDLGNTGFETKREAFSKSEFKITQRISEENSMWDPDRIAAHQKWLARQATAIWRIPQLSE